MDNKERLNLLLTRLFTKNGQPLSEMPGEIADAIAAANLLAREWISVTERLPDGGKVDDIGNAERMVLVYSPNPPFDWGDTNFMVYNPGAFTMKQRPEAVDRITHWQPLPDAPKDNHDE